MASRSPSWSVLCNDCGKSVEIFGGDFQSSFELHKLKMHPTSDKVTDYQLQKSFEKGNAKMQYNSQENFTCPLCKQKVLILNNRSIQEHFDTHRQNQKTTNEEQLYSNSGINTWMDNPAKSEKDVSVFQNTRKNQKNSFINLPADLRQHRAYITENGGNMVCKTCSVNINPSSVVEHLKTKTHEDSVILFLKNKLPLHLQHILEFVSFYNSNLSCNLCRYKIESNSYNVHETIVNIISHNADTTHSSKKSTNSDSSQCDNVADSILRALSVKHPLIKNNKHSIGTKVEPQFNCTLCDKNIAYNDNEFVLAQNFIAHLNSSVHKKSEKAISLLKSFEGLSIRNNVKHRFHVSNGNITCVPCKRKVEADVPKLLSHMNDEDHTLGQASSAHGAFVSPNQGFVNTPTGLFMPTEMKKGFMGSPNTGSQNPQPKGNTNPKKVDVKEVLRLLQQEYGDISFLRPTKKGQLTCSMCNCSFPTTISTIKIHLNGKSHKNNGLEQATNMRSLMESNPNLNPNGTIANWFQSLPQVFQGDMVHIKPSPIEGYVVCTLCSNRVINPYYLKDHLQEENHTRNRNNFH